MTRTDVVLRADPSRVLARLFVPGHELSQEGHSRASGVMSRILALSDEEVDAGLRRVHARYAARHRDLPAVLESHYAQVAHRVPDDAVLSPERRSLVAAWFTNEYAVEAAALFNPSAVAHPDQSGLAAGECRFLLSLRAVGEGHLSSVEFRTGVVGPDDALRLDALGPHIEAGRMAPARDDHDQDVDGSYDVEFPEATALTERVLWPQAPAESHGIEDVRFVRVEDDGVYRATYTAFDGASISPQLIETTDFRRFRMSQLAGPAAQNKGMALFPRRIGGRHFALSRYDRENISVTSSADGRFWGDPVTVQVPSRPWELIQLGNCGSPVETDAGWVVLTHGVGPMREYAIGALLLDLDEPGRVIGALPDPLLVPADDERDGYVPNVVYSCGALRVGDRLLLPYGASDASVRFAFVDLPLLVELMVAAGPPAAMRANSFA